MNAADWTAVAAVATALLAVATVYLAWKTRSMATETKKVSEATLKVAEATLVEAKAVEQQSEQVKRQVSVSAEALRASVQPWLVWQPYFEAERTGVPVPEGLSFSSYRYTPETQPPFEVSEESGRVDGWFTLRNVGSGIAILSMANSYIYARNAPQALDGVHPTVISPIVAVGDTVVINFTIPADKSPDQQKMTVHQLAGGEGDQLFAIEIGYGDSLGTSQSSAKYLAHRNESKNKPWSIVTVEYQLPNGEVVRTGRYG